MHEHTEQHLSYQPGYRLAPREGEALVLGAIGKTTKEAAKIMNVAPATVKAYQDRAREKLGAKNIAHAVSIAWEKGLLTAKHLMVSALILSAAFAPLDDNSDDLRSNGRVVRTQRQGRSGRRREKTFDFLPPEIQPEESPA